MKAPLYCAVGLRWAGSDSISLLSDNRGRIVVFDGPPQEPQANARSFIGALADGRMRVWSKCGEICRFMDVEPEHCNELQVITDIDVYDTNTAWPMPSETKGRDWRRHVIWNEADWGQPEGAFMVPKLYQLRRMDKAA